MQFKAFIFVGLLLVMANVQAQDSSKNNAANLELIELLGGLGDFSDDSSDSSGNNNVDELEALEEAMRASETKNMAKKPSVKTQDMILKDKHHPIGGEKQ